MKTEIPLDYVAINDKIVATFPIGLELFVCVYIM